MELSETIYAYGHSSILATHRTTLEVTKDERITKQGNCIVATLADKSVADLSNEFKETMMHENARLVISIKVDNIIETVRAFGSSKLTFSHLTDIVVRKSEYVSDRTIAVRADKAACDLSRKLVKKLQDSEQEVEIVVKVYA